MLSQPDTDRYHAFGWPMLWTTDRVYDYRPPLGFDGGDYDWRLTQPKQARLEPMVETLKEDRRSTCHFWHARDNELDYDVLTRELDFIMRCALFAEHISAPNQQQS